MKTTVSSLVRQCAAAILCSILLMFRAPTSVFASCTSAGLPAIGSTKSFTGSCSVDTGTSTGVDHATTESSTTNDAVLALSGTAGITLLSSNTLNDNASLYVGSVTMPNTSVSISIQQGFTYKGQFKTKQPMWVADADADGWATNFTLSTATASGKRRLGLMRSASTVDCNDTAGHYSLTNSCGPTRYGDGHDGNQTLNGNIETTIKSNSRTAADGDAFSVSAIGTNTVTLTGTSTSGIANTSASTSFAAGDEVMLINLQGSTANSTNVGTYEDLLVNSVSSNVVTLTTNIANTYGVGGNSDLTGQNIILQRVPNYGNVTTTSVTTNNFSGGVTIGGVIAFKATGTLTASGGIQSWGGYPGGTASPNNTTDATAGQGASYTAGTAGTGGCSTDHTGDAGAWSGGGGGGHSKGVGSAGSGGAGTTNVGASGGGGGGSSMKNDSSYAGCGGGGGGGGHATGGGGGWKFLNATQAQSGDGSTSGAGDNAGDGGSAVNRGGGGGGGAANYGIANLTKLTFGGGGGGGGCGQTVDDTDRHGGDGGEGGGIIFISAPTITVSASIVANGGAGSDTINGKGGHGGGGAGGSIKLVCDTCTLGTSLVQATGGLGSNTSQVSQDNGGDGGSGRIRVEYLTSYTGSTNPSASFAQQ